VPVDHKHKQYRKMLPVWRTCRAVLGGSWEAKDPAVARDILPPLSGQKRDEEAYSQYLSYAHFFPGAARAREGFVGLLNEDPAEVKAPAGMKRFLDDAVGSGAPVTAVEFTARAVEQMVDVWRFGVLTNYPERQRGKPVPYIKEAEDRGLRPRWRLYQAEDILDWHEIEVGGQKVLAYVVLHEQAEVPAPTEEDEHAWADTEQWVVLDRALPPPDTAVGLAPEKPLADGRAYRARTYRRSESNPESFELVSTSWPRRDGRLLAEIQFDMTEVIKPPLSDAVDVNVDHYRVSALHTHGLVFVANPMAYLFGYDPDLEEEVPEGAPPPVKPTLRWEFGSSKILVLKNPNAKAGIVSATAANMSATMEEKRELRDELVAVVGRILAKEKKAAETAEAEELRRQGDKGVLTALARAVSVVLTRALERARDWMQVKGEVSIRVSTEFFDKGFTPEEAQAIADLWLSKRLIAKSDVRTVLRRGGILERNRTDELIDAELAEEGILPIPPAPGDGEEDEEDEEEPEEKAAAAKPKPKRRAPPAAG
jgi:hypothetical protein